MGSAADLPLLHGASYVGVIIPAEMAEGAAKSLGIRVEGYWTPDSDVVSKLESRLRDALERGQASPGAIDPFSKDSQERGAFVTREIGKILEHFGEYRRQYVGIILPEGARRILVNSFPSPENVPPDFHARWRQKLVAVDDGGFWYWRIQYDVKTEKYLDFDSNGYA